MSDIKQPLFAHLVSFAMAALALVGLASVCAGQNPPASTSIDIRAIGDSIQVTVPVSQLILAVPKASFDIEKANGGGAAGSPRYFKLMDQSTGQIVSGWFESSDRVGDLRKSWDAEMAAVQGQGYGKPLQVEEGQSGVWQVIIYGIPLPSGSSTHIRASTVSSGTWIDLHLSVSSAASADETRRSAKALLGSLQVRHK